MSQLPTTTTPAHVSAPSAQSYFPTDADWKMMLHMGATAHRSGLLPAGVKSPEAAAIIALKGRELGIPFMVAVAHVHIINGKPTLSAEMMQTLARKNLPGLVINIVQSTDTIAEVEFKRPESGSIKFTSRFTIEDAKKAKLLSKDVWIQYPAAMLYSRAVSAGLRKICPEALLGVSYTPEELGAPVDESGKVIEVTGKEVNGNGEVEVKHPSDAQLKRLFAIAKSKDVSHEKIKDYLRAEFGIESTKDLTLVQYDIICKDLENLDDPDPKPPTGGGAVIKPKDPETQSGMPIEPESNNSDGPSFEQYIQHEGHVK